MDAHPLSIPSSGVHELLESNAFTALSVILA